MINIEPESMNELKMQLMDRAKQLPLEKQITMRLVKPNTWLLNGYNPSLETPTPFLLIADDCCLLIDPTEMPYDLRSYIETYITDKPIKVFNTHSHDDHTLCNSLFNDCEFYMSDLCWQDIQEKRAESWDDNPRRCCHEKGDYVPTQLLKPGDVLNLGGRELEILPFTPGHSPSSLVVLDRTYGILFPGDELESGQVNNTKISIETFRDNLLGLKSRMNDFDMICSPHNGAPFHAETINYFIENCERIMSGIEGDLDVASMSYLLNPFETRSSKIIEERRWDPNTRRSTWKGTSINYNINMIFND